MHAHRLLTSTALAASLTVTAGAAVAQNLINSNTTIHNSLCVGTDCATTETYGSDTIRLKENNLRIHFDDTSTSASFPTANWRLQANDQSNGGASYFAIVDADNGNLISVFEDNAPSNSLRVDDAGRVGFGTATPAVELHRTSGDTPTLRLDQTGASGWQPQRWDLAGNETSFFIRDASNGSTLPFRVRPSAPSNALVIDTDGDVGVGTLTSDASLHVKGTAGDTLALIEEASGTTDARGLLTLKNNGTVFMTLEDTSITAGDDTGASWNFQNNNGTFRVTTAPGGPTDIEMQLDVDGNLTIEGEIITAGSCSSGCDRVFDADYPLPSIAEQRELMFANRHLPNVGPTAEDGPMNLSAKVGGILNELEKAHIYIGQLEERAVTRDDLIAAQQASLEALQARLDALETRLD